MSFAPRRLATRVLHTNLHSHSKLIAPVSSRFSHCVRKFVSVVATSNSLPSTLATCSHAQNPRQDLKRGFTTNRAPGWIAPPDAQSYTEQLDKGALEVLADHLLTLKGDTVNQIKDQVLALEPVNELEKVEEMQYLLECVLQRLTATNMVSAEWFLVQVLISRMQSLFGVRASLINQIIDRAFEINCPHPSIMAFLPAAFGSLMVDMTPATHHIVLKNLVRCYRFQLAVMYYKGNIQSNDVQLYRALRHEALAQVIMKALRAARSKKESEHFLDELYLVCSDNHRPSEMLLNSLVFQNGILRRIDEMNKCLRLFDKWKIELSVTTCNNVIHGYKEAGDVVSMEEVLSQMIEGKLPFPNHQTAYVVLMAYADRVSESKPNINDLELWFNKFSTILEEAGGADARMYNILMKGYTYLEKPSLVEAAWNRMLEAGLTPTIHNYNTFMDFYCSKGHLRAAKIIRRFMERQGVRPDKITFSIFKKGAEKAKEINRNRPSSRRNKQEDVADSSSME